VFEQIVWREPKTLAELNFLPADRDLIERLAAGTLPLPGTSAKSKKSGRRHDRDLQPRSSELCRRQPPSIETTG
jgi:hypothetical protein